MTKSERINIKERVDDDTIDLSLSNITEIPVKDIATFKRATILDLSNNKIATLGKNFGTLSHITKLDLSKNQINLLPGTIGRLTNLRHLDLYDNKLEHLPLELGQLKNLRYLDLKGNPLTPALAKIVGPCLTKKDCENAARNIVKFLAEMQVKINEECERLRYEKVQQTIGDKVNENIEVLKEEVSAVPEKTTPKSRREKKKKDKQAEITEASVLSDENIKKKMKSKSIFCFLFLLLSAIFGIVILFYMLDYYHYLPIAKYMKKMEKLNEAFDGEL